MRHTLSFLGLWATCLVVAGCDRDPAFVFRGEPARMTGSDPQSNPQSNPESDDATAPATPSQGSDDSVGGGAPGEETAGSGGSEPPASDGGDDGSGGGDPGEGGDGGTVDDGGGEVVVTPPGTVEEVAELCGSGTTLYVEEELDFPHPAAQCAWNANGNLGRVNERLQARFEQSASVSLPHGAVICSADLRSTTDNIHYDDEMFLLLENKVIMASLGDYVTKGFTRYDDKGRAFQAAFPNDAHGLALFDWMTIRGSYYSRQLHEASPTFCLGQSTPGNSCQLPESEHSGPTAITLRDSPIYLFNLADNPDGAFTFTLVTTGDNDDSDCSHTGLRMKVKIGYSMPAR